LGEEASLEIESRGFSPKAFPVKCDPGLYRVWQLPQSVSLERRFPGKNSLWQQALPPSPVEPDVALNTNAGLAEQRNASMKDIVNQAPQIRLQSSAPQSEIRYRVLPHRLGLRAGLDLDRLNDFLDDLEVSDGLAKLKGHS
jgi:hypothetical protein